MVTALLVTHRGARWLPAVLDGLSAQSRPIDRVLAVDTGSTDETLTMLAASPLIEQVLAAPDSTSFSVAVRQGLAEHPCAEPDEWIWLVHDDANPAADALACLLEAADEDPTADVLGPKLREWPSLRRLLELGVTISGTGHRETGLEHGEYDQGQHDTVRHVLAVNTAGMLVRRSVLEKLGGFDDELPLFGNDVDFGWRAARAGHRTIVVPRAVMFHAEAAHRRQRPSTLADEHPRAAERRAAFAERRAALWTLLANGDGRWLPVQAVRLFLGSILRAIGLLLVRDVRTARAEMSALASVYGNPGRLRRARRARQEQATVPSRDVRPLLAPWWLPYRHGLDAATDFFSAVTLQAQDVAERRRAANLAADLGEERPPHRSDSRAEDRGRSEVRSDEESAPAPDNGWVVQLLTSPVALGLSVFLVVVAIATRDVWGAVAGGALPPAPAGVGDWWRLWTEDWHPLESGTNVPAPAYVPVLTLLGGLLGGSAQGAMSVLMVFAFPIALGGAWRLLRVAGHLATPLGAPRWLLGWGAMVYALVPATSGAWGEGRYSVVAATALLPWLAHAALGLVDPNPDRRWRAGWRSGLLLALMTAFAPVAWPLAALLTLVVLLLAIVLGGSSLRQWSVLGPALATLGTAGVLLVPWWLPMIARGHWGGLLLEPGLLPVASLDGVDVLTGRISEYAAPFWPGLVVVVLAMAALIPASTRLPVLVCWLIGLVTAVTALALSLITLPLGGGATRPSLAFLAVVLQGVAVVAVVIAGTASARDLVRGSVPRVTGAVAGLALLVVPVLSLGWFATIAENELAPTGDQGIPAYMEQSSDLGPAHGIVVLEGDLDQGLVYTVRRGDGPTVGEPEIIALTEPDAALTDMLGDLVSRPRPAVAQALADHGIEYVVLSSPADPAVAAVLDTAPDLAQAGTEDRTMRAWQVTRPLSEANLAASNSWTRTALLILQGIALVVVLVLCAPSRKEQR